MSRFFKIYIRKIHRWLAIPTKFLIPLLIGLNNTSAGFRVQRIQQLFMIALAATGSYLLILPWWVKRNKKKNIIQ